jgi:hypothetical protein
MSFAGADERGDVAAIAIDGESRAEMGLASEAPHVEGSQMTSPGRTGWELPPASGGAGMPNGTPPALN